MLHIHVIQLYQKSVIRTAAWLKFSDVQVCDPNTPDHSPGILGVIPRAGSWQVPVTLHVSLRRQHKPRESLGGAGQLLLGACGYKPGDLFASNRYYIFYSSIFIHVLSFSSICCTWENGIFILESKLLSAWAFRDWQCLELDRTLVFSVFLVFSLESCIL